MYIHAHSISANVPKSSEGGSCGDLQFHREIQSACRKKDLLGKGWKRTEMEVVFHAISESEDSTEQMDQGYKATFSVSKLPHASLISL